MTLLQLGREKEAEKRALQVAKSPDGNATSAAVLGAVLHRQRKYQMARDTVRDSVQNRNVAALAVAALSDLAMGARTMAYKEARDAVNTADMTETQYVAQAALADAGDHEGARRSFRIAFLRSPLFLPALTSRAYEVMAYDKAEDRFVQALNLFDIVLRSEPDNAAAIAGRLAAYMQLKRYNSAQPLFQKLSSLEPTAPDLFILLAANYDRNIEQHTQSLDALGRARKIDPVNYKDTLVPQITDLIVRMTRLRREIPLTPALLDRAELPNPTETIAGK
jgi:tetratricopeptide (TPR) repeat protein